jgi:hypothetical protein
MVIPRRSLVLSAALTAIAGAVAWLKLRARPRPTPPDLQETVRRLMLLTRAIIRLPVEDTHYENYYIWRLTNLPAERQRYQRLVGEIGEAGTSAHAETGQGDQDALLAVQQTHPEDLATLRREVLALFARTDALVHLGYESWPGTPRGFLGLTRRPSRLKD